MTHVPPPEPASRTVAVGCGVGVDGAVGGTEVGVGVAVGWGTAGAVVEPVSSPQPAARSATDQTRNAATSDERYMGT